MATIEERAKQWSMNYCTKGRRDITHIAYEMGAIEQRRIDIDKACEWLKRELAEPMPEELYQQWCSEKLEDFIKAMEE